VEQKVVLRCCVRAALQEARLLQKHLFFERFSDACPEPVLVTFRILVVVQWHRNKDVFRTEGWKSTVCRRRNTTAHFVSTFLSYVRLFRACLGKMIVLIFENNWKTKGNLPRQAYRCGKVTSQCFFDLKSQQAARWKLCKGGRRLPWLAQLEQQLVA